MRAGYAKLRLSRARAGQASLPDQSGGGERLMSKWLTWGSTQPQTMADSAGIKPTKPSKPNSVGFGGAPPVKHPIIREVETGPAGPPGGCQYSRPEGVRLSRYTPREPPSAVTVCS